MDITEITGSISHGTHRHQDLIPLFMAALRYLNKDRYAQVMVNGALPAHAMDDDEAEWWGSEDANYLLHDLFDALSEEAPTGYYFGAHPGDGSDFGFWPIETDLLGEEDESAVYFRDGISGQEYRE